MNFGECLKIGLKIAAAIVAGVTVFIGINKTIGNSDNSNNKERENERPKEPFSMNNIKNGTPVSEVVRAMNGDDQYRTERESNTVVGGLRSIQSNFSKLSSLIQAIVGVAENLSIIMNGKQQTSANRCWERDTNYNEEEPRVYNGMIGRKITPFITEVMPVQDYIREYYNR